MTVTIDQIQAAIIKYIDTELAVKATGTTKFMIYFFAPSVPKLITEKFKELVSSGMVSDLLDENGNINLDETYKRAKEAIHRSGRILIPKINYFVDERDVEILYNIVKGV